MPAADEAARADDAPGGPTTVGALTRLVRSKNAGPFRLTIDCFCDSEGAYARLRDGLDAAAVAERLGVAAADVTRFDLDALLTIKLSLPRPLVQGAAADRDLHGAQWAIPVAAIAVA